MRRSFLSVLVLASLIVGVESCKKGDTGPAGPAGPTGAKGDPGATGAKGTDGTMLRNGTGAPAATLGNVNDFYIDTQNSMLYGPKTDAGWGAGSSLKGATGPAGAGGGTGGGTGATGPTGPKGDTGAAGSKVLVGANAPTATDGAVGDVWFATATSTVYGPKTAAGWGTGAQIGVTATPRVWFFDLSLGGVTGTNPVLPYNDTTLTLDPSIRINASYKIAEYDVVQRLPAYPGWGEENGREILFIDGALTTSNQDLMVPVYESDLVNTLGRRYIYTKDPANAKFMAVVRRAGYLAGLNAAPGAAPGGNNTLNTDPTLNNAALPAGIVNPVGRDAGGMFAGPASTIPYQGGSLKFGIPGVTSAAIRAQFAQAVADLGLTGDTHATNPPNQFTFNTDDSIQMRGVKTVPGGVTTNNPLCYWMYARIVPNGSGTTPITTGATVGQVLDFLPAWKKADAQSSALVYDYDVKKTLDLNNGNFFVGSNSGTPAQTIAGIGAAWTAARKSGSIDFKFMYGTPKGYGAASDRASQSSIAPVLLSSEISGGTIGSNATWAPGANPRPANVTGNSYTGAPLVSPNATYPAYLVQNLYNTWVSLDDLGVTGAPGSNPGVGLGSGAANDYSLENGAHGSVYFMTPPPYYLGTFTAYNGGRQFSYTDAAYGTYNVLAPTVNAQYPYGGVWIQNGVIQLNYWAFNGGTNLRNLTSAPSNYLGTTGSATSISSAYSYRWVGPKGFIGASNAPANGYWRTAATGGSYYDGPWPSNQNPACEGYFFTGAFRPKPIQKQDDVIIKFKIQTIPSSNPDQAPVVLKADQQVK